MKASPIQPPIITLNGKRYRVLDVDERYLRERQNLLVLWIGKFPVVEVTR